MELNNQPLRTAVLGTGKVAHTHARALAELPGSRLVAVAGRSAERAAAFAAQYGARPYTDLRQMIRAEGVQALTICTPHPAHAEAVEIAAEEGAHVLVEKPLAPDLAGCDRAIRACEQHGVQLGVISQRRLYPPVLRMAEAIRSGKIGRPALAELVVLGWRGPEYYQMDAWRGRWDLEGGGVLVNQTVHQLDLFQWLLGPVQECFGYWDNLNHPEIEVEDTAVAVVRFQSGALGQITVSNSQRPGLYGRIHVHGANGASIGVQTDGGSPFVAGVSTGVEPPVNDLWTVPGEEECLAAWQKQDRRQAAEHDPMSYYHRLQIEDFLEAARAGRAERAPMVDGREGRKSVELFTAIYRSQRDGRPARFPLAAEEGADYDGRLSYQTLSHRRPVE